MVPNVLNVLNSLNVLNVVFTKSGSPLAHGGPYVQWRNPGWGKRSCESVWLMRK
jgi:hypothetical protein